MTTAAAIIIGDEILSGKVRDQNTAELVDVLAGIGVDLMRVVIIPDEPDEIARHVSECSRLFDYVITSGGVGPTHDDRTMAGVAQAFGREVVRAPKIEARVRRYWKERINDAALKLAEIPKDARLLESNDNMLPVVVVENVYILPGVPQLFTAKLARVASELRGARRALTSIYLSCDESAIAAFLTEAEAATTGVKIGSYPRIDGSPERVRVTVESASPADVQRTVALLTERIPPNAVLRVAIERQGSSK